MPQLIAMVIVVVGAMIYMFQTFGGTGDKIEGVAQKGSVITEINNIKDGLKIAAKSGHIEATASATTDAVADLAGLAELSYFAEQINEQVGESAAETPADKNTYYAISFSGSSTSPGGMAISMATKKDYIPGIYVDLSVGNLKDNAAFLEAQVATDLAAVATIDRHALGATAGADADASATGVDKRIPKATATSTGSSTDGKFIVYFRDFGSSEVVK